MDRSLDGAEARAIQPLSFTHATRVSEARSRALEAGSGRPALRMGPPPAIELARDPLSAARNGGAQAAARSDREPPAAVRVEARGPRQSPSPPPAPSPPQPSFMVDRLSRDEVLKLTDRVLTEMDKRRSLRADRKALR
ncbi:hypothetical protein WME79_17195 [Sorangium sp. So ce726]|uniref:hypothetical protein n=1 Tax=Sorangium sp. So ce726 TaxID=3133319 RepID=UPI003F5E3FA8